MKKLTFDRLNNQSMVMILGLALILISNASCSQNDPKVKMSIEEMNKKFISVFKGSDASKLAEFYCSDGQLMPSGSSAIVGAEQILGFWQAGMNAGASNVDLKTVEAEKSGNKVIEQGIYTIFAGENLVIDKGKYIVIWKNEGGKLKIYRDIWNTDNPPPPSRAIKNDTIYLINDFVKADMLDTYLEFNEKYLKPVSEAFNTAKTVRILRSLNKNDDDTYTCIYLVDPSSRTSSYSMLGSLVKFYGEEKGNEYFKLYKSCIMNKSSSRYIVNSVW